MLSPKKLALWPPVLLLILPVILGVLLGLPVHTSRGGDDVNFALRLVNHSVDALRAGVWLHSWVPQANSGYGSPVFYFYGFLPSLLTGLLAVALHLSPAAALSLAVGLFRIAAFTTSFLWLKQHVSPRLAGWGALLYVSLPFLFLENPFVRFAFAEMLATAILPLGFYWIDRPDRNPARCLQLACVTAILAITHLPQTALMLLCIVPYAWLKNGWRSAAWSAGGGVIGLAMAGFFIGPALLLQSQINASAWIVTPTLEPANNFLFDPRHLRIGRYQVLGEICLHASWLFGLAFLWNSTRASSAAETFRRLLRTPMLVMLLLTLAGMTRLAWFAWTQVHFLHQLQFPWRLMPICMLMTAGAAIVCVKDGRLKHTTLMLIVTILICTQTAVQLIAAQASAGTSGVLRAPAASYLAARLPNYTNWALRESPALTLVAASAPEYIPRAAVQAGWRPGIGPDRLSFRDQPAAAPNAGGDAVAFRQEGAAFVLKENPARATTTVLPQFFFPGWGVPRPSPQVIVSNDAASGLVRVNLPAGSQELRVERVAFRETQLGWLISIVGVLAALTIALLAVSKPFSWKQSS